MTLAVHQLNRGMVIDVGVGETVLLHPSVDAGRITVTVEAKSGQRARIRFQSDHDVQIELPKKHAKRIDMLKK